MLEGEETARYWDVTLPEAARAAFPWPGLLLAPVLLVPVGSPQAYVRRYAEPDKARTGLGAGVDAWSVPYWYVDTAFSAMVTLLAAVDEGLGALLLRAVRARTGGEGGPRHPRRPPVCGHDRPRLRQHRRRPAEFLRHPPAA